MEERGGGYDLPVNPSGTAFYRAFLNGNPSGNPSGAVSNPSGWAKELFSVQFSVFEWQARGRAGVPRENVLTTNKTG
jgi:hypothetical protein